MDLSIVSKVRRVGPRGLQDRKVAMTRVPIKGGIAGDAEYWDALDRGEFKNLALRGLRDVDLAGAFSMRGLWIMEHRLE